MEPTDYEETAELESPDAVPLAIVRGEPITSLPRDLYIPPDALEVFLDAFEGPLDLLLYLIKRQNLDILDIPLLKITQQYMEYVELMKDLRLDLAGEYLVMAAMLAEIKSRMLLPRSADAEEDENDPRAELVRRLQEYERYRQAAEDIDALPQVGRDIHLVALGLPDLQTQREPPAVDLQDVVIAFRDILKRARMYDHHHIQMEPLSVRERMSGVLEQLQAGEFTEFSNLFDPAEGRMGVVVTLLALLELVKESLLDLVQAEPYAPIYVQPRQSDGLETDETTAQEPQAS